MQRSDQLETECLKDIESARIAREAVETSGLIFENIDVAAALQYLRICGGSDYINDIGFKEIAPRFPKMNDVNI